MLQRNLLGSDRLYTNGYIFYLAGALPASCSHAVYGEISRGTRGIRVRFGPRSEKSAVVVWDHRHCVEIAFERLELMSWWLYVVRLSFISLKEVQFLQYTIK